MAPFILVLGKVSQADASEPGMAPEIWTQPVSQTSLAGGRVMFTVSASGALGYHWQQDGTNLSGANSSFIVLTNLETSQAGEFRVIATNEYGAATSSVARLSVSTAVEQSWEARYNGPGNSYDYINAMVTDEAGCVYVTGVSHAPGTGGDYATVKYDAEGKELWVARYDGAFLYDEAKSVAVDNAGNVYVSGESEGTNGYDYALVKYDANGNQLWAARYDDPDGGDDRGVGLALDSIGNVYVTGYSTNSATGYDYVTIKYDAEGNPLWVASYDGPRNYHDRASALALDGAGNVYVTGYSMGNGTGRDYATVKYDTNGTQIWAVRYNGAGKTEDSPSALRVDNSGNVYVTGTSTATNGESAYLTIKYDTNGVQLWAMPYGATNNTNTAATALALDSASNVYVTGASGGAVGTDFATVKYDANGNQLWETRYHGPNTTNDCANAVAVDSSGNVYVTGYSTGLESSYDLVTVKYNATGNEVWVRRYDGSGNTNDSGRALIVTSAGEVCVGGYAAARGTGPDYATLKYNAEGEQLWVSSYIGPGEATDGATAVAVDGGGNVYVSGNSYSFTGDDDYATAKYDANGNQLWVARYNGPGNGEDQVRALAVDSTGNVYVTGSSYGSGTNRVDYATVKYDPAGGQLWVARYSGPGGNHDKAQALALDSLGNVYVTGYSYGATSKYDYATVKYDAGGNQLWVARYDAAGRDDYAYALGVDGGGNVYVTGSSSKSKTNNNALTIKYDPDGNQLWEARYGGTNNTSSRFLAVDSSGNVYVGGTFYESSTETDYATLKYDPDGNLLWAARYNGTTNGNDYPRAFGLDSAGNVYVSGLSQHGLATLKYDANGNQLWAMWYSEPDPNHFSDLDGLAVDNAGNVYLSGYAYSYSWSNYYYVTLKYDSLGNQSWVARYEGEGAGSWASAVAVDSVQNLYVTGWSVCRGRSRDFMTIKYVQNPVPETRLDLAQRLPGGEFQFRLTGEAGRFYDVQASTNLAQWDSLTNIVNPTGQVPCVDNGSSSEGHRFYRAVKMP